MRAATLLAFSMMSWLTRFGGPGLILVGLVDNSVIPIPGGMDVATILLSSAQPSWWPFYGVMATLGAVIGGGARQDCSSVLRPRRPASS